MGKVSLHAFGGDCHNPDCDRLTSWDMSAVVVNDSDSYCSPECASEAENVKTLALHDPQYHARRPSGFPEPKVDFVIQPDDVHAQLSAFADWLPSQ